jgi:hypothetical protein
MKKVILKLKEKKKKYKELFEIIGAVLLILSLSSWVLSVVILFDESVLMSIYMRLGLSFIFLLLSVVGVYFVGLFLEK